MFLRFAKLFINKEVCFVNYKNMKVRWRTVSVRMITMKKSILIFRSASYEVIFSLINYILENNKQPEIHIIIQKESMKILEDKYPNINYIMNEDGFFKYDDYLKNNILRNQVECRNYDEIYIPSSTIETSNFHEIQTIISKISKKRVFFYNCLGELSKVNTNVYYLKISKMFQNALIYIFNVLYFLLLKIIYYICLIICKLV